MMKNDELIEYVKDVLQYSLFSNPDQNNEYDIEITEDGLLFIPIYPVTFVIDETLYTKIFNILSVALTPQYTMIRPLTMQVVTLEGSDISSSRGLLFPMREGRPKRIVDSFNGLIQRYYCTGNIPIMEKLDWSFSTSPDCIIAGNTGSGKSYELGILFEICKEIGDVEVIDPKGSDLARLAKKQNRKVTIPQFLTDRNEHGLSDQFLQRVIKRLKNIENLMYQRQSELYQRSEKVSTDYRELGLKPYFIFIDELAALMVNTNKKISTDFKNVLTRLILLGRESGIYLIFAMQSARAEYLPTIVRDSISLRIQLGRINSENTRFLFPELKDIPMIPLGGKGTGIISIAGDDRYAGIEPVATPTIIDEE